MSNTEAIDTLRERFPWPTERPDAPTTEWGWGVEGEYLLQQRLPADATVILEVGSLVGGSARFFAKHWPDAHLVCVDPWIDTDDPANRPFLEHVPELTSAVLGVTDGIYNVFRSSLWDLRDRLTPVRGFSPDRLVDVHHAGVQPDIVYIDGSHVYEDVLADVMCSAALFPNAVLCGDDWNWPGVHHAVNYVAVNRGGTIHRAGNTWIMDLSNTDGGRRGAPSARTTEAADRSLPVRALQTLQRTALIDTKVRDHWGR